MAYTDEYHIHDTVGPCVVCNMHGTHCHISEEIDRISSESADSIEQWLNTFGEHQ